MIATDQPPGRPSNAQRVLFLLLGGGMAQVAGLLTMVLLARMLAVEANGTYRQLLLISGLVVPVFSGAVSNALAYFLSRAQDSDAQRRAVLPALLVSVAAAVVVALLLVLTRRWLGQAFNNPALPASLVLFAVYPALLLLGGFAVPLLVTLHQARLSGAVAAINALLMLIMVGAVVLVQPRLDWVLLAIDISAISGLAVTLAMMRKRLPFALSGSLKGLDWRAQLAFMAPIMGATLLYMGGLRINQFVVSTHVTPREFAIYAIGATEIPLVGMMQGAINNVLLPELARLTGLGEREGVVTLWRNAIDKSSAILLPIFFSLLLLSEPLVVMVFSRAYEASVPIFQAFLFLIPLRLMTFSAILKAHNRPDLELWGTALFMTVSFVLGLVAVRTFGLLGVAVSSVLSLLFLTVFYVGNTVRLSGLTVRELLPRPLWVNLLTAGVPFVPALAIAVGARPTLSGWSLAIACIVYGIGYLLLGGSRTLTMAREMVAR